MVADATAGSDQVDAIGAHCYRLNIKVAAILVARKTELDVGGEAYLANLRLWAHTLAIVRSPQMVSGMLHGLGA